ncbi:MAG TPA: RcpC/CpaB family pilus assembly protein [Acidimicrobiales bacterium]|nr:RcpC/CpaB family pilus assembly protein [Acidimicrobiales bacterium]
MKRQTLILVVIGLVLFIAGGGIAFATVMAGTKTQGGTTVAPYNTPVVVATGNIAAGTTGQSMVAQGLVSIRQIPQRQYQASDLTTVQGLSDEVLTTSVTKGHAIEATQLTPSAASISIPKGDNAVSFSMSGVNGLAGYLQPGSTVDVYANITKVSQASSSLPGQVSAQNLNTPCTELIMSNIQVLDVSNVTPALGGHSSSGSRAVPTGMTLLVAVNPTQARLLTFMAQNEALSVTETQKGAAPVQVGVCISTFQTSVAP